MHLMNSETCPDKYFKRQEKLKGLRLLLAEYLERIIFSRACD